MQVPALSIVFIILNFLLGLVIPIAAAVYIRRKYQASLGPFFVGCGIMLVFALILEQIVHSVVLSTPVGAAIRSNIWLMALYGGLMAGLFEETGRYFAMKFLLRKQQGNPGNALMYGAGHGGFEVFAILTIANLNNLIYAVMLNAGQAEVLMAPLDDANRAVLQNAFQTLAGTSPFLFLLAPVERLSALIAHIAMSTLVWTAVTKPGKIKYYFLAIALHFLLDAVSAVLSGLGVNVVLIETAIFACAAAIVWIAFEVHRKNA